MNIFTDMKMVAQIDKTFFYVEKSFLPFEVVCEK